MIGSPLKGFRTQCAQCGEYFGNDRAFDRHRLVDVAKAGEWRSHRRCLTAAEMGAIGQAKIGQSIPLSPDAGRSGSGFSGPRVTLFATDARARMLPRAQHAAQATWDASEGA